MKNILTFACGYVVGGLLVGYSIVYILKRGATIVKTNPTN